MHKNTSHMPIFAILIAIAGLVATTAAPAAQRPGGGRAEAGRVVRVSPVGGPALHAAWSFELQRVVQTLIEIVAEPTGPDNGTLTVSDDPDPTSDAPVRIPGEPGEEDGDRPGVPRLRNDVGQSPNPLGRFVLGTPTAGL